MSDKIKVGITHGDYNGIGYELILKILDDGRLAELCTPVIYGSAKIAANYRKQLGLQGQQLQQVKSADQAADNQACIINVIGEDAKVETGNASREAGKAAFDALERAVADLREGKIDVLVTAPINKATIHSELFPFPGHTEYLETSLGEGSKALMILFSGDLRVALVTIHVPGWSLPAVMTCLRTSCHSRPRSRCLQPLLQRLGPVLPERTMNADYTLNLYL